MGNSRARAVYEAQLPDGFRRPQTDSALENFIRGKYEHKKYLAKEWVPTQPPKIDWNKEIDEELEKQKRKKKTIGQTLNLGQPPQTQSDNKIKTISTAASNKNNQIPVALPKPLSSQHTSNNVNSPKQQQNITSNVDLLSLSSPTTINSSNDISGIKGTLDNDIFSNFLSATTITDDIKKTDHENVLNLNNSTVTSGGNGGNGLNLGNGENSLAKQESDFFNQSIPNEKEKAKLTKDSIMALYGNTNASPSTTNNGFMQQNQFGAFNMGGLGLGGSAPSSLHHHQQMVQPTQGGNNFFNIDSNNASQFAQFPLQHQPQQQQHHPLHQQTMPFNNFNNPGLIGSLGGNGFGVGGGVFSGGLGGPNNSVVGGNKTTGQEKLNLGNVWQ